MFRRRRRPNSRELPRIEEPKVPVSQVRCRDYPTRFTIPLPLTIPNRNWPKWYLQSYLLGVPTLIVGNRSKRNSLTGLQTMSMEVVLATTVSHSPDFKPALALARIHNVLSALIQHCKTRAGYLRTGCFTCELKIRSQGNACVPPVAPNPKTKAELLQMWELVRETDFPSEGSDSSVSSTSEVSSPPPTNEDHEPFTPEPSQPPESPTHLLSRIIIAPFALYCTFNIFYNVIWKISPITTIFQIVFFHLAVFVLIFSATSRMVVLFSC